MDKRKTEQNTKEASTEEYTGRKMVNCPYVGCFFKNTKVCGACKMEERIERKCISCGKTIYATNKFSSLRYCDECAKKSKKQANSKCKLKQKEQRQIYTFVCVKCGKQFETRHPKRKKCNNCVVNQSKYNYGKGGLIKDFTMDDPWASGRLSEEITKNQFTGMNI